MIEIKLDNLSKRFNQEIIFKNLNYHFSAGNCYAITGANGSGKSTLLKTIAGFSLPSKGSVKYHLDGKLIDLDEIYKYISIASPYMELIEDFTLQELLIYHSKFKAFKKEFSIDDVIDKMDLTNARQKAVKNFSSGMKQRVKLGLAFFSKAHVTFLDEPTTNLDVQGAEWYQEQLKIITDRLIIIASNQKEEYHLSNYNLKLAEYK
ncbi:MAG: ABC transporter ATP-binding protein [Bacteroidota bacterium]